MTKYYVYTQQWCDTSIANCYDAYTDNEFLMKEYLDQIDLCLKNSGYISPAIRNDILEIKASGGIKTYKDAIELINKGVTRIGTSNAIDLMKKSNCRCENHK